MAYKSSTSLEQLKYILVTDVGSTTTKARLFEKRGDGWRYVISGETPTTVETPYEDVTIGVKNAIHEIEELTEIKILKKEGIIISEQDNQGVGLYCTTSSAGGGLQMMVGGVIGNMTGESAKRAALGAGAIVMDVIAQDDDRLPHVKIRRIRSLRPDMILLAGGTDGGTIDQVLDIAELFKASEPTPRLGTKYKLPIVFAGNKNARQHINKLFAEDYELKMIENIRPILEKENLEPSRNAIHELFMEHVMSHAPGYDKLMKWTDIDILPTPAGEGMAMQLIARNYNSNVLGVGLGGATTNIYSVINGRFVRSVSANLGMSYSVCNVMKESKIDNIVRWLPFEIDEIDLRNRLANKMIRPTTIPHTLKDLLIEHAIAREALRLGLEHHTSIASRLKGAKLERTITEILSQELEETYIKMMNIPIIVGTGGLLSHAPNKAQSFLMLTDSFQPEGIAQIFQDSVFMMPHLGVLSTVYPEAAWNIFDKDCLVRVGTIIAPSGQAKEGDPVLDITLEISEGNIIKEEVKFGKIIRIPLPERKEAKITIKPHGDFDVGQGKGRRFEKVITGGVVGIVIDARGRPIIIPENSHERKKKIIEWFKSVHLYPDSLFDKIIEGGQ